MRVAVAQILSGTDPADNLQIVRDYTGRAVDAGASLVVFPEATMCRFGVPLAPIAEPVDGPWADGVRRIAADAGITVVAGMFTPADDGRVHNTLLVSGRRRRRPLRQDPPLRRVRVHRVEHRRARAASPSWSTSTASGWG